jgi:predicted ArsR family transcriptional regulator
LLVASLFTLSACNQQPAAAPDAATAPTDAEAAAIVDAAEGGWTSADTGKIMAAYKEGGVWFDPVCPFDALAKDFTGLVCGMNLALLEEATGPSAGRALSARLEPEPGRCCVTLVPTR